MMSHRFLTRLVAALLTLLSGTLLLTAGCHEKEEDTPPLQVKIVSSYVGNAACADCHKAEFQTHHGSRHDTTLRAADQKSLGTLTPTLGVIPLAGYSLAEQKGQLMLSRSLPTELSQRLDYVLGSGKLGMTYVALMDAGTLLETHMSYFPNWHRWEVTPGQHIRIPDDDMFGRKYNLTFSRRCIACHSTTLPDGSLKLDPQFYGVGCESCHGPGRKHIEALQGGNLKEAHMEKLGSWKGSRLNELCGACHRSTKDVDTSSIEGNQTHRFQPFALQRSACRTADGEPLSCLRCHDPHTDVSADEKKYEVVCLQCHGAKPASAATRLPDARQGKVCPVNAASGCISCHMRPLNAFPDGNVPATMVDHLISRPKANP